MSVITYLEDILPTGFLKTRCFQLFRRCSDITKKMNKASSE